MVQEIAVEFSSSDVDIFARSVLANGAAWSSAPSLHSSSAWARNYRSVPDIMLLAAVINHAKTAGTIDTIVGVEAKFFSRAPVDTKVTIGIVRRRATRDGRRVELLMEVSVGVGKKLLLTAVVTATTSV